MLRTVHDYLIEALKLHTSENKNVVDTLIRITPMSKEAAYRRLRGENPFSLSEACRISETLGLSIDKMVGIDKKDNYMFHLTQVFNEDPFEKYCELLEKALLVFDSLKEDPETTFYFAGTRVPNTLYFRYQFLSKYSFFKWFYQASYSHKTTMRLEDVVIPQKVQDIQQKLYQASLRVDSTFIVGDDLILSIINDVKHFASIDLLKPEEVAELKKEVLSLLDDVEELSKTGSFSTGKKVSLYVSNAYFDCNYCYLTGKRFKASTIYLFGINQLDCIDPVICEYQKQWIDSLVAHSTLISGSGKLQGTIFFDQQRKLLNTI